MRKIFQILIILLIILIIVLDYNLRMEKIIIKQGPFVTNSEKNINSLVKWSNLDVAGFKNVIKGEKVLVLEKALIRNDGENNFWRGDADIGIHIYYEENSKWIIFKNMRLYGPYNHGLDTDGSEKYEWCDYNGIFYCNYGILEWKNFPGNLIKIKLEEGDHGLTKNDIIFNENIKIEKLKTGNLTRVDGDTMKNEATLWFRTYDILP